MEKTKKIIKGMIGAIVDEKAIRAIHEIVQKYWIKTSDVNTEEAHSL